MKPSNHNSREKIISCQKYRLKLPRKSLQSYKLITIHPLDLWWREKSKLHHVNHGWNSTQRERKEDIAMKSAWVLVNTLFWNHISKTNQRSRWKYSCIYSLPTVTFFPDNWQDFTSATKPCLNNLVDSLISLPLVPEHSCVLRAWVGFRTHMGSSSGTQPGSERPPKGSSLPSCTLPFLRLIHH